MSRVENSVPVHLLFTRGTKYSTVAWTAIGMDRAKKTQLLLLFTGRCLVAYLKAADIKESIWHNIKNEVSRTLPVSLRKLV
jgi:hypothetical protein